MIAKKESDIVKMTKLCKRQSSSTAKMCFPIKLDGE
jgi:hypothetical protein